MNLPIESIIKDGYNNYQQGNPISDVQLSELISNHKNLLRELDKLNSRQFDLFRNRLFSDLQNFEGFVISRKNNKNR